MIVVFPDYTHLLFYVLHWLWSIYKGARVWFITNSKHSITYLALTQRFLVLLTRRFHIVKYTHSLSYFAAFHLRVCHSLLAMDAFRWGQNLWFVLASFL